MTDPNLIWLTGIKRRQRDLHLDPVQCRLDRDWLVGRLEEELGENKALRAALQDVEVLARDAQRDAYAAAELAHMVRTDHDPAFHSEWEGR